MPEILKPNFNNGLWASGGAIVAPSNVKIATGWTAEVPPFQWENYSQNRQDQGIAHILQHGISVWDALTEYQAGKSYVQGSDGSLYLARTTNTGNNPVADTSFVNWVKFGFGSLLGVRNITSTGTYTPTPGMKFIIAEWVGAGGGSGVAPATGAGQLSTTGGGASGSYGRGLFTAAVVGASQAVVIGLGGTAGNLGVGNGGNGGATSMGSLFSAPGGNGSPVGVTVATTGNNVAIGGTTGGSPTGGNIISTFGQQGMYGISILSNTLGGAGGSNPLGTGGQSGGGSFIPTVGGGFGSGGGGPSTAPSSAAKNGTAGAGGVIIVYEYA